jgi:hypothetical protein
MLMVSAAGHAQTTAPGKATAPAQTATPTYADLQATYCIPVVKWQISTGQQIVSALAQVNSPESQQHRDEAGATVTKLESVLDRLRSFLVPRMFGLDSASIADAYHRGENDVQAAIAMSNRCSARCGSVGQQDAPDAKAKACFDSCSNADLGARLKACQTPTWLPY